MTANTAMNASNNTRTAGKSRPRARQRRRLTPFQKFVQKNLAQIVIGGLLCAGFLLGTFVTYNVMSWRNSHQLRDFGRELVYTTYTVRSGDTMWSIASDMSALNPEFPDMRQYLSLLQRTNHNYGDVLLSGTTIIIPYYQSGTGRDFISIYERYGLVQELEDGAAKGGNANAD